MSANAGRQIAAAWAEIERDNARDIQELRYAQAKAIVATIPSGTRDAEITAKQRRALDQYEDAARILRELREVGA